MLHSSSGSIDGTLNVRSQAVSSADRRYVLPPSFKRPGGEAVYARRDDLSALSYNGEALDKHAIAVLPLRCSADKRLIAGPDSRHSAYFRLLPCADMAYARPNLLRVEAHAKKWDCRRSCTRGPRVWVFRVSHVMTFSAGLRFRACMHATSHGFA